VWVKDPSGIIYGVGLQLNFGNKAERPPVIIEVVREVREIPGGTAVATPTPDRRQTDATPSPRRHPPAPKGGIRLKGLTFATDSSQLNPDSGTVLDTTAASLKPYPDLVVRGYTDSVGSAAYNAARPY
jgi:outer membrane protein OmpA-like peptidoglycan-associated protein